MDVEPNRDFGASTHQGNNTRLRAFYGDVRVPMQWNVHDRYNTIEIGENGCIARYRGAGKSDSDAAAVRTDVPIRPKVGIFYFEITILDKGHDGFIGIGLSEEGVSLNRLPGWDPKSYGYHGDDGRRFRGTGRVCDDIVCVMYRVMNYFNDFVFYTKNGNALPPAFPQLSTTTTGCLYPAVGMRTQGEAVSANFGKEPFMFDIETYVTEQLSRRMDEIADLSLSSTLFGYAKSKKINPQYSMELRPRDTTATGSHSPLELPDTVTCEDDARAVTAFASEIIVMDYLAFNGHSEAAMALAKALPGGEKLARNINKESIAKRRRVCGYVIEGDVYKAIEECKTLFPGALEESPDAYVVLCCQHMLENKVEEAMQFGTEHITKPPETSSYASLVKDTFWLLAYPNPSESPVGSIMNVSRRNHVANMLNQAILRCDTNSSLETVIAHTEVIRQAMDTNDSCNTKIIKMALGKLGCLPDGVQ